MQYDPNQCADSKRLVFLLGFLVYRQFETIDLPKPFEKGGHPDLCARAPRIQTRLNRKGGLQNVHIPNQRLR